VKTTISPPFFEIGPKTFLERAALLEIVRAASAASARYHVDVIITPPALDIEAVRQAAPGLWIFAQSMDPAQPGTSTGAILPEALAAVGADGVMLNHAERPLNDHELSAGISRAREAGMLTLVCADDVHKATRYAALAPDLILLEPHSLIGGANGRERPPIARANAAVASVDAAVLVMHSGGVSDEQAARAIIAQGASGTGCTTAIVQAADRRDKTTRMIRAVREAWDARRDLAGSSIAEHATKAP
jgi:triosephosphate isomerase (TIM)